MSTPLAALNLVGQYFQRWSRKICLPEKGLHLGVPPLNAGRPRSMTNRLVAVINVAVVSAAFNAYELLECDFHGYLPFPIR